MELNNKIIIQELIAHFANSFDAKDWDGLESCLTESLFTDYSDLRGTSPGTISASEYVKVRREASIMRLTFPVQRAPPAALRWSSSENRMRKNSRHTASISSS